MSEVHRYNVVTMLSKGRNTIGYDPHGPEIVMASEFDRVTAERDALQMRLNTADQRIDDVERALGGMLFAFDDGVGRDWSAGLLDHARKLTKAVEFKPTESGASVNT